MYYICTIIQYSHEICIYNIFQFLVYFYIFSNVYYNRSCTIKPLLLFIYRYNALYYMRYL